MSRNFPTIRFKVTMQDISSVRREFLRAIGKGYVIRSPTNQEDFYSMLDSLNKILLSVDGLRASWNFPLYPFMVSYLNSFGLTLI